jgi:uncharacterized protein (TIGR02145 family)
MRREVGSEISTGIYCFINPWVYYLIVKRILHLSKLIPMKNMFRISGLKISSNMILIKIMLCVVLLFIVGLIRIQAQTVTDIDGNVYNTVTIGTQVWMKENLKTTKYNDNTSIPLVTIHSAWVALTTPGYCWYNNDAAANKTTYGALYNWYAVDATSNGGKNVCPTGWHVPTDNEWTTMENYLIANGYNYDGTTTGNKYAKAMASASGWSSYSGVGTVGNTDYPAKRNATGFTALPGGYRWDPEEFINIGSYGSWWSSSEVISTYAWSRYIFCGSEIVSRISFFGKSNGFSVRCLRDQLATDITNPSSSIIEIYPNPVSGILNIDYKGENFETVSILNSQGALLTMVKSITPIQQLDFSKYLPGLYFLEYTKSSGEIKRVKVIKR